MLRVIETFSGIGSQVQALKNIGINHEVVATVEWELAAIFAYDIIHNGPQDLTIYRHHTKESLLNIIKKYNLSNGGSEPLSERALRGISLGQLKSILYSIERNNNLVDIKTVTAKDLPDADVLTYSFPCQDLSVSGHWHNRTSGIDREANNRSTLLWEIERILMGYNEIEKSLPTFLLMENVSNILSSNHIDNFLEWLSFLESLGYVNQVITLDSRKFGIPQTRVRTYVISVLAKDDNLKKDIESYFTLNNLENKIFIKKTNPIGKYLRLDYDNEVYRKEAIESIPSLTKSRKKIYDLNVKLAVDRKPDNRQVARTVTTKQDRHPNSGIIAFKDEILHEKNNLYRNLTPRECFLLMGFEEKQFDSLMKENFKVSKNRMLLTNAKLMQLAGNSIVVPVLEEIFCQINTIKEKIIKKDSKNETGLSTCAT